MTGLGSLQVYKGLFHHGFSRIEYKEIKLFLRSTSTNKGWKEPESVITNLNLLATEWVSIIIFMGFDYHILY